MQTHKTNRAWKCVKLIKTWKWKQNQERNQTGEKNHKIKYFFRTQTQISEAIFNRKQERKKGILDIEEMNTLVKQNVKSEKLLKQNIQQIWDTTERQNLRITGIKKGKEAPVGSIENACKNLQKKIPELKNEMPIKVQKTQEIPYRLEQKRKPHQHKIIKRLNIQNK